MYIAMLMAQMMAGMVMMVLVAGPQMAAMILIMKTIRPLSAPFLFTVKVPILYPRFKLSRPDDNGVGCWT